MLVVKDLWRVVLRKKSFAHFTALLQQVLYKLVLCEQGGHHRVIVLLVRLLNPSLLPLCSSQARISSSGGRQKDETSCLEKCLHIHLRLNACDKGKPF